MIKSNIFLFCTMMLVGLSGCGGTGQDEGRISTSTSNIQGVAIDGYLAGSLCYLDLNENFKRDAFEPSALTDAQGYYSYNPGTDVDYCRADASSSEQVHCLQTALSVEGAPLRCRGGYDVALEVPFEGTLSTTVDITAGVLVQDTVVSPLTTLLSSATTSAQREQIFDALNVTSESELAIDYIENRNSELVELAIKVQKISQILAEPIKATHSADEDDPVIDPVGQIYEAMVDYIIDNTETDIVNVLSNATVLSTVAQTAESLYLQAARNVEDDDTNTTSAGNTASVSNQNRDQAAQRARQVNEVASAVCSGRVSSETFTVLELNGCLRATEVVVQKALGELDDATITQDNSIDTAVTCLTSASCETVIGALSENNFDITQVSRNDFSDPSSAASDAALPSSTVAFNGLAGQSLRINDPDNVVPDRRKHGRIELYFGTSSSTSSGPLSACIRYIDGDGAASPNAVDDSDLSNGDTRGAYVAGNWQLLGTGFSVLLQLNITDSSDPYEAIMKSVGINSQGQTVFRFDFDDALEDWLSVEGIVAVPDNQPTSDAACRERFNTVVDSI